MSESPNQPAAGAVPIPPPPPASPPPVAPPRAGGRPALWIVLAAVVALIVGAGIGVLATQSSTNDMADQRDAARSEIADLQRDLSTAQSSAAASSTARDACSRAATDAKDLIAQHENLWTDLDTYFSAPANSAAEAEMIQHMNSQQQTMVAQRDIVNEELSDCRRAVGS